MKPKAIKSADGFFSKIYRHFKIFEKLAYKEVLQVEGKMAEQAELEFSTGRNVSVEEVGQPSSVHYDK